MMKQVNKGAFKTALSQQSATSKSGTNPLRLLVPKCHRRTQTHDDDELMSWRWLSLCRPIALPAPRGR